MLQIRRDLTRLAAFCSKQGHPQGQPGLLRALSSLALNPQGLGLNNFSGQSVAVLGGSLFFVFYNLYIKAEENGDHRYLAYIYSSLP